MPKPNIISAQYQPEFFTFVIAGPSRIGKTYLAATACEVEAMSPVLFIDNGKSSNTLMGESRFANIDVTQANSPEDVRDIYNWLLPVKDGGEGGISNYRTIVLDELGRLHRRNMRSVMLSAVAEAEAKDKTRDEFLPGQQEWGKVYNQFMYIADSFISLPAHIILISLSRMKEDKKVIGGDMISVVGLPGQLADDISALVDVTTFLDMEKSSGKTYGPDKTPIQNVRVAKFAYSRKFAAGVRGQSRFERLGASMQNPTMAEIYSKLIGE